MPFQTMHVLIIKTSSLGDLIHTFPALTDAATALPTIQFDWLVDQSFAEVPTWHPAIQNSIKLNLRYWRKQWRALWQSDGFLPFVRQVRQRPYDLIIDAQGLCKSALPAALARGPVVGYDRHSIRESLACVGYQQRYAVPRDWHAIQRIRSLFAQALHYTFDHATIRYGIQIFAPPATTPNIMLLHGTTWPSKTWPLEYWVELARLASTYGHILLPGHTAEEQARAQHIVQLAGTGEVLPPLSLNAMARQIAGCAGVVGLDSGLAHLAAALQIPAVTLYGPTRVDLTGALGTQQINLVSQFDCAPCMQRQCDYAGHRQVHPACFAELTPTKVWQRLQQQMNSK